MECMGTDNDEEEFVVVDGWVLKKTDLVALDGSGDRELFPFL